MRNYLKKYFYAVTASDSADRLIERFKQSDEAVRLEYAFLNLASYVLWTLNDAVSKKIKTLYFVSREGYILKKLADIFVEQFNLDVICKYLYCSARSLQIPAYHLMGDEKYELLFKGGYGISPYVIAERALLTQKEREQVYNDICFDPENEHTHFSLSGRKRFAARLLHSSIFKELLEEKSKNAYENATSYLAQEGLTSGGSFALVRLGFDVELQKTIGRLLKSRGYSGEIKTYYFGLYDSLAVASQLTANSFYFNSTTSPWIKAKLNSTLLTAICRAPHTETMSYAQRFGEFSPLLVKKENESEGAYGEVEKLHRELLDFTREMACEISFKAMKKRRLVKLLRKINNRIMYLPEQGQAMAFCKLHFYNGGSEANGTPLVSELDKEELLRYSLRKRLRFKKRTVSDEETSPFLFWGYGALALSTDFRGKGRIRRSMLIWDMISMSIKHRTI